jgi:uncharacterized protein
MVSYDKITILHHDDADGFGSAFAIWCNLTDAQVERLTCIPVQYGQPAPEIPEDTTFLMILDFSYSRETCEELHTRFPDMVIIDHHKTAQKELEGLEYAIFDMSHSGCVLSYHWAHLNFGTLSAGTPTILQYVEDRDLWTWKLKDSKLVNLAIASAPQDFYTWLDFDLDTAKAQGRAIESFQSAQIKKTLERVEKGRRIDKVLAMVNCTDNISEVGNAILERFPDVDVACMWFDVRDTTVFSLRSREGGVDVSKIAKRLGGGGHAAAAGFTQSNECAEDPDDVAYVFFDDSDEKER